MTSTLLPALFLLPLYPLAKRKFFPPSQVSQYRQAIESEQRSEELAGIVDELVDEAERVEVPDQDGPARTLGIGVDLSKVKDAARASGIEVSGVSKGKISSRIRLRARLRGERPLLQPKKADLLYQDILSVMYLLSLA